MEQEKQKEEEEEEEATQMEQQGPEMVSATMPLAEHGALVETVKEGKDDTPA